MNTTEQINAKGEKVWIDWEIVEHVEHIHGRTWYGFAQGIGHDGTKWESECIIRDQGGDDWEIVEHQEIEQVIED